jgi:hypothetical protein
VTAMAAVAWCAMRTMIIAGAPSVIAGSSGKAWKRR